MINTAPPASNSINGQNVTANTLNYKFPYLNIGWQRGSVDWDWSLRVNGPGWTLGDGIFSLLYNWFFSFSFNFKIVFFPFCLFPFILNAGS